MVTMTMYTSNGKFGRPVRLDLMKSEVADRLDKAIAAGELPESARPRFDSGRFALLNLLKLRYTPDEIRAAVARQAASDLDATTLHAEIDQLLVGFAVAKGGDRGRVPDAAREAARPGGQKKFTPGDLRKSEIVVKGADAESMRDCAARRGWSAGRRVVKATIHTHREHPDHALTVRDHGAFEHSDGSRVIAGGDHDALERHLRRFHGAGVKPEAGLKKSMSGVEGTLCGQVAKAHGWRVTKAAGDGFEYHHAEHGGHSLTVSAAGDWTHEGRGAKPLASGGAGQLADHLGRFHHAD